MQVTYTLQNINEAAAKLWQQTTGATVVALHGLMGTGKTTLVHALCGVRGVKDTVGSPTFSIINEYRDANNKTIYHLDLYRLDSEEEAIRAGVEDCLYSGDTCLVEWPEKAPHIFPPETLHVYIDLIDEKTRRITIAE